MRDAVGTTERQTVGIGTADPHCGRSHREGFDDVGASADARAEQHRQPVCGPARMSSMRRTFMDYKLSRVLTEPARERSNPSDEAVEEHRGVDANTDQRVRFLAS